MANALGPVGMQNNMNTAATAARAYATVTREGSSRSGPLRARATVGGGGAAISFMETLSEVQHRFGVGVHYDSGKVMLFIIDDLKAATPEERMAAVELLCTAKNKRGDTLLHILFDGLKKHAMAALGIFRELGLEIDWSVRASREYTPLHFAALHRDFADVLTGMIALGADKSLTTTTGEIPYDVAERNRRADNMAVLKVEPSPEGSPPRAAAAL